MSSLNRNKILKKFKKYHRLFKKPLSTAHGIIRERTGFLIKIEGEGGFYGLGEAAPLIGFSPDSIDETEKSLSKAATRLTDLDVSLSREKISGFIQGIIPKENPQNPGSVLPTKNQNIKNPRSNPSQNLISHPLCLP